MSERDEGGKGFTGFRKPIDVRMDAAEREGLTGTAPQSIYRRVETDEPITRPPDGRPLEEQPVWRQDFPIDWPQDQYIARRDFTKFMILTSGAFAAGQVWIGAKSLVEKKAEVAGPKRIAPLSQIAPGSTVFFTYPTEHEPGILIRTPGGALLAYSQKCTHLACAVVPRPELGLLRCPCHEGYFDLETGRVVAGPPPRPLPRILLEVRGDDVYAVGLDPRTS